MKATILAAACTITAATANAAEPDVPYPDGYRDWRHVKSMVIEKDHPLYNAFGGIHHIYANEEGVQGYRQGRFPDGSVLVFDLLEAVIADGAVTEGSRKVLGVMHKDAMKYSATGGWGFEGFGAGDADNRVVGDNAGSACFACHLPQESQDFTFSKLRD
ncbi:MAG: cytochrome C [Proteobacteria bacterium]|nr:MAG: cytochrome C [Pseudomonadota bacterium]